MSNKININGKDFTIEELNAIIDQSKKPKQLFYPNGAVVNELEEGQEYFYWNWDGPKDKIWGGLGFDVFLLKAQSVFLTKEACKKFIDIETTHNRLLKKIIEINAENGWEEKWPNYSNFYLTWDSADLRKESFISHFYRSAGIFMSEQAKDYMMSDAVSIDEFKKFLKIYN